MKKAKGITLISLIITIIVMLILVGITINLTIGDNGILSQADNAKIAKEIANEKEWIQLALSAIKISGKEFDILEFENEIEKFSNQDVTVVKQDSLAIEFTDEEYKLASLNSNIQLANRANYEGVYNVTYEESQRTYSVDIATADMELLETILVVEPEDISDWEYTIESNETITIHYYTGDDTEIVVPNSIGGIPVKKIAYKTQVSSNQSSSYFYSNSDSTQNTTKDSNSKNITKVIISKGIKNISISAFKDYTSLTSIIIPSSVTNIGESAFSGCSALTNVTIPNSVTSIGESAFSGCSALTNVTIPNSVTSISDYAFSRCSALTSIIIPSNINTIGDYAFNKCTSLQNLELECDFIGNYAFADCSSLQSLKILDVGMIKSDAFNKCTKLTDLIISQPMYALLQQGNSQRIQSSIFKDCSNLINIYQFDVDGKTRIQINSNWIKYGLTETQIEEINSKISE